MNTMPTFELPRMEVDCVQATANRDVFNGILVAKSGAGSSLGVDVGGRLLKAVMAVGRAWLLVLLVVFGVSVAARAQVDQGSVTGVVQDSTGAAIPNAEVKLTSTDTGLVLTTVTNGSGDYTFSPVKIGNYQVRASAQGFPPVLQEHVHVDVSERPNVVLKLPLGSTTAEVTVSSAPPLLDTQASSVGQVVSSETLNDTPLNGRNWVYIAQLTAGVVPGVGARGQGTGDFDANGQRTEQNNFILDGVDNNVSVVDFTNGSSYVVRPPPDALAEFKVETGNYSAEYGHSAGAVINASTRAGSNDIHGDVWEYFRNDALDATDWNSGGKQEYRQNQFGATLGLPVLKNKFFAFADVEANRIVFASPTIITVPTALMRTGNFSELLSPTINGTGAPIPLYTPNSGGATLQSCNGQNNVLCPGQIDSIASNIVQLFPLPNYGGATITNNYQETLKQINNTVQWDGRLDYIASTRDQAFARFSYFHSPSYYPSPLGPVLDGGAYGSDGTSANRGENFALSETHIFTSRFVNEFRFGYNYGLYGQLQPNSNTDVAASFGMAGIPFGGSFPNNGGLPRLGIGAIAVGAPNSSPTVEGENVYQILDNVTRTIGNHSIRMGVNFQSIRFRTQQAASPRGAFTFNGQYTSNLNATNTGYPLADFLTDQVYSTNLTQPSLARDVRWYRAAYVQDDWRATHALTVNLGLRYDFVQPYREESGGQENFVPNFGTLASGTPTAQLLIPSKSQNVPLAPFFTADLAADNVSIKYYANSALATAQNFNFAPRVGLAYSADQKTVVRAGFGIFFGGLENRGGATNIFNNYPYQFTTAFPAGTCKKNACPSNGLTLETGFTSALATGLINFSGTEVPQGTDPNPKTPYVIAYNLAVERGLTNNLVATLSYVGNGARHLQSNVMFNSSTALANPSVAIQTLRPFPAFGAGQFTVTTGVSNYNALQAKLEQRVSHNLGFLATYTYSHSLDDAPTALTSDTASPNPVLLPQGYIYSNSAFDTRHRVTVNGHYTLPLRAGANSLLGRLGNQLISGWESSLTFAAQTGQPFTVQDNIKAPTGVTAAAYLVGNPFASGGTPNATNPGITCAPKTRTVTNWYNPCAFANPLAGTNIPATGTGSRVSDLPTVLQYVGGRRNIVFGPGYERVNMSVFKDIATIKEQKLQLRADIFNVLNTPAYGTPSTTTDGSNGGLINSTQSFQRFTPDARFFQLSAKYIF